MGVFDEGLYLDPKYDYFDRYVRIMHKGRWTPAKYEHDIMQVDMPQYHTNLPELDKQVIKRCIQLVSTVEDKVKLFWSIIFFDFPQTIFGDVGGEFASSEVTHRRSYHSLAKALGIDVNKLGENKALADRLKYLSKYLDTDPKIIGKKRKLKKLILFTALVERASLFTQFYILMSYNKHKRGLLTISSLQKSTAKEENIHYSFGIDLINVIKHEYPSLWDEYLVELVEKNINMAYEAELKLIDWMFEEGIPEHLTKEEVVNFLNYNFSVISTDLQLDLKFKYDEDMYTEKNEWFTVATEAPVNPDFFNAAVGDYSSEETEINVENFEF